MSEAVDRAKKELYQNKLTELNKKIEKLDRLNKNDMLELFTTQFDGKSISNSKHRSTSQNN